jgi:hypothetical protein
LLLKANPHGLDHGTIVSHLKSFVDKTNTVSTALYRMKERGLISLESGMYKLIENKNGQG